MSRFYMRMNGGRREVTRQGHSWGKVSIDSWSYGITVDVQRGKDNEDDEWYIFVTSGSACTNDKELLVKLTGQEIYDLLHPDGDGTIAGKSKVKTYNTLLKLYLSKSERKKNND